MTTRIITVIAIMLTFTINAQNELPPYFETTHTVLDYSNLSWWEEFFQNYGEVEKTNWAFFYHKDEGLLFDEADKIKNGGKGIYLPCVLEKQSNGVWEWSGIYEGNEILAQIFPLSNDKYQVRLHMRLKGTGNIMEQHFYNGKWKNN